MALDLLEMRELASQPKPAPNLTPLPDDEDEDDEVDSYIYDDDDFTTAMDLLIHCKQMLGFYGDRKVSGAVVASDQKRMLKLASEVEAFVNLIDENSFITE